MLAVSFHPIPGRVALIEPQARGRGGHARACPLIGVVGAGSGDVLTVTGVSSPNLADGTEVVVSIFAPEALYRLQAAAYWADPDRLAIDPIHHMERVQRRRWTRHPLHLDVKLGALGGPDPSLAPVNGRTIDLGMGGLRVETRRRLPLGDDVTVMLTLPDGAPLVERSTVVSVDRRDGPCEYGLAFDRLDDVDTGRLAVLIGRQMALTGDS
jgi:PilZ domain